MAFYLGKRRPSHGDAARDDLILFQSSHTPTRQTADPRFVSAIGPFASQLGASYYARYGQDNPAICTCADAERLAREDPNPVWQAMREQIEIEMQLSAAELAEICFDQTCEYEPDRPQISSIDVTDMLRHSLALETLYQEMM
jgi:hypothetical protein